MPGEFDFLRWIRSQQKPHPLISIGVGDDLAALNWPKDDLLLVGVDQVLDGVHFDSTVHSPRSIGRKAMNRNLSDCAAMACLPAAAVATVALPKGVGAEYAKELFLGMKEAGELFDCPIVGGDTGSWAGKLAVTVTILGRSGGVPPVTRSGAKPGNGIFVTGPLGGSLLGRHMTFTPKVHAGRTIASNCGVTAMIDLSDGLSRDLAHICDESGVGALITTANIPIHEDAVEMRRDGHAPLEHALHDGEDYELLFTATGALDAQWPQIGMIIRTPGIWLLNADDSKERLQPKAWEHSF